MSEEIIIEKITISELTTILRCQLSIKVKNRPTIQGSYLKEKYYGQLSSASK